LVISQPPKIPQAFAVSHFLFPMAKSFEKGWDFVEVSHDVINSCFGYKMTSFLSCQLFFVSKKSLTPSQDLITSPKMVPRILLMTAPWVSGVFENPPDTWTQMYCMVSMTMAPSDVYNMSYLKVAIDIFV
jgi:hypothetical protein